MAILSDKDIRSLCDFYSPPFMTMLDPFSEAVSGNGIISYGITSAGYDLRIAGDFLVFNPSYGLTIDPKRFKEEEYRNQIFTKIERKEGQSMLIPPNSYVLGRSVEYIRMPRHLKARCTGKSTYARAGILINTTPLEPAWEGHLTIEIGNVSPCPALIYVGEGIAQIEFETLTSDCEVSYADKAGQYQNQIGVTPSRVKS